MCILFFEPLCSFYEIPAGVLRGTGHSLSPAIAAIIGTCCFRIIWIYTIFGEYCQLSVLYYAFPISWILTIVLIMIDFAIVIKNRQPLKQNFMLNCKETMVKKKRIVILVCIPSSRQLKKYKIFVLPGWISGNIFMPPIVAFHEIPLVLRLQVLSVAGRLYSNLYIL